MLFFVLNFLVVYLHGGKETLWPLCMRQRYIIGTEIETIFFEGKETGVEAEWAELLAREDIGCSVCTCYEQFIYETASEKHSKKCKKTDKFTSYATNKLNVWTIVYIYIYIYK